MPHCEIVITDEVNCKITNLSLDARKKLVSTFKYDIPGAKFMPAVRLGRWDGKMAFFSLGGDTYINLLPEIIPILENYNYTIELVDNRSYRNHFPLDPVEIDEHASTNWPDGHILEGKPIRLDTHQLEVINAFLENPQSMTQAATGAGKTVITATLSKRIEPYGRSLVIVPNKSLVTQTEADYKLLDLDVGVYYGDRKELGRTHTISTWQSLSTLLRMQKKGQETVADMSDFLDGLVCVIVDECFAPGTPVLTPTGYVPIESLRAGDKVINYSENDQTFKEDTVVKSHQNLTISLGEQMYKLEFDNGKTVDVTGNHKFLTDSGWVRADELTENHNILDIPT